MHSRKKNHFLKKRDKTKQKFCTFLWGDFYQSTEDKEAKVTRIWNNQYLQELSLLSTL